MAESIDLNYLIDRIENDRVLKTKFRKALELDDDYAKTSDVNELRGDMNKGFEKIWEEMKAQREAMRNEFDKVWKEMKAQREEMRNEFDKVWKEMKAQREEMKIGFERLWEEVKNIKLDLRDTKEEVKKTHRRLDKHEEWLKSIGGSDLEMKSFRWFMAVMDAKGEDISNLKWRVKFKDEQKRLGTEEIEIDIFSEDPLYVVEITNYIDDIKKLIKLKKKSEFIREKFGEPKVIIITNGFTEEVVEEAKDICKANNFEIFDVGWRPR
ncbi:MAG: hypothetical protein D6751_09060 [Deltaproteobacteria bacterium]|nr:MAG: hypothetical protein D6751_09060 [Deltaproteobacteria bacterium]